MNEPCCISTLPAVGPEPSTDHPDCIPAVSPEPSEKDQGCIPPVSPELHTELPECRFPTNGESLSSNLLSSDEIIEINRQEFCKERSENISTPKLSDFMSRKENVKQAENPCAPFINNEKQATSTSTPKESKGLTKKQSEREKQTQTQTQTKTEKRLLVSEKIDLDRLTTENPPTEIKGYKPDYAVYILSCVSTPSYDEQTEESTKFVPLHSKILRNVVHNYPQYIKYFTRIGVLESDNKYFAGVRCKAYAITEEFIGKNKRVVTKDWTLYRNLSKDIFSPFKKPAQHDIAIIRQEKTFSDGKLEMQKGALRWIKRELKKKKDDYGINRYNYDIAMYYKYQEGEHKITRDTTTKRLHSTLTRTPRRLRKFLTYQGKPLIELDLTNSQPYMSLLLFKYLFWKEDGPGIHSNTKALITKVTSNALKKPPYMLQQMLESPGSNGIEAYGYMVENNELYDWIARLAREGSTSDKSVVYDRNFGKNAIFNLFFSSNQFPSKKYDSLLLAFREKLPAVFEIFTQVKALDYKVLSHLLQLIEAHLVLDLTIPKMPKEIPAFTIHDSIVTIPEHADTVKRIFFDTISEATGNTPRILEKKFQ